MFIWKDRNGMEILLRKYLTNFQKLETLIIDIC